MGRAHLFLLIPEFSCLVMVVVVGGSGGGFGHEGDIFNI